MRRIFLWATVVACSSLAACGSGAGEARGTGGSGDATASGGSASGGSKGTGGATGTGGTKGSGGTSATGGTTASGGAAGRGPSGAGTGGASGRGGAAGAATSPGTGGRNDSSGSGGNAGSTGSAGSTGTGGDGSLTIDCTTPFPSGGMTYTGTNVNGKADGLGYGIWTNGSGGSITVFSDAHAFSATWSNSSDFLAHLGLDFNTAKPYTDYGTITAEFSETKTGTVTSFSEIGVYGWMHSPCVEWYINEDTYGSYIPKGSVTVMIDGAMYYMSTSTTTGTGGANACESGHTGSWTNITSTRVTPRSCGTVTVSDHFAAWAKQGWNIGSLASVHINVEVGGGSGTIQFPIANVTTTSQ